MKFNEKLLIIVLFIILFIKLKDFYLFLDTQNVITGYDAFYYARLTEELLEGNYTKIDTLRDVPDFSERPFPPTLLTVLGYIFSLFVSKELVYAFLPPLFSVLFLIPLYLWLKKFSNVYVFVGGAVLGSLNGIYFFRTAIGKFDTDFLILFFVFLIFFLFSLIIENFNNKKSILFSILAGVSYILFQWFYPKPSLSLLFLTGLLLIFLFLFVKEKFPLKKLAFLFFTFFLFLSFDIFRGFLNIVQKYKAYFLKEDIVQFLPTNPHLFVKELQPLSIWYLIDQTTGNSVTFFIAVIGFVIFFFKNIRFMLPTLPFILLGLASLKAGSRFLIYLAPFLGMGLGYSFFMFFSFIKRNPFFKNFHESFFLVLLIFFSISPNVFFIHVKPVVKGNLFEDMRSINQITEKGSTLWTWWDYGYAFEYISRRGTYIDNGNRNIIKMYAISRSLLTYDEDFSYKLISFISNEKNLKTKKLSFEVFLKNVELYRKKPTYTVYIPLYKKMLFLQYFYMLGMIGSGIKEFNLPAYKVFQECKREKSGFLCGGFFKIRKDLSFSFEKTTGKNVKKIAIVSDKRKIYRDWDKNGNLYLQVRIKNGKAYFTLIDKTFYKTVFNRMYFLKEDFKHFECVHDDFPHMVLYKVKR